MDYVFEYEIRDESAFYNSLYVFLELRVESHDKRNVFFPCNLCRQAPCVERGVSMDYVKINRVKLMLCFPGDKSRSIW